jgi:ribonuclease HII
MKFGCDEAGRGSVLGSMFVACVYGKSEDAPEDVQDSKNLSNKRIHQLKAKIENSKLNFTVVEITAEDIDNKKSMTDLSAEGFACSIRDSNLTDCSGYIDCFANDEGTAETAVKEYLEDDTIEVTGKFKADENYPLVSAASIIAKDSRETHVEDLKSEYGNVGSGYPSDPTTRMFLENYVEKEGTLPDCARRSWSTSADILEQFA